MTGPSGTGVPGWHVPGGSSAPPAAGPRVRLVPAASVLGPLVRITARGLLGRRRIALVGLLAIAPVLTGALLALAGEGTAGEAFVGVFDGLILSTVVPLAALLLGTSALGAEIEDGTVVLILVRPYGRVWLALAKLIVAGGASAIVALVATLGAGALIVGTADPGVLAATALASVVAAIAYASIFVTLSAWTGRALVAGLFYVIIWEGVVASLFAGTRVFSVRAYGLAIAAEAGGPSAAGLANGVAGVTALVLAAVVTIVSFWLAVRRLDRFQVSDPG